MKWWHQHGREGKLSGLHPFQGEQFVRNILEFTSGSLYEQDLDPMIVLELHMQGTDHFVEVAALKFRQPLEQISFRFVVHDCDRPRHQRIPFVLPVFKGGLGHHH